MVAGKTILCQRIIILAPEHSRHGKPVAYPDSLDCADPHHGTGDKSVQLAKDRISKTVWTPAGCYFNNTSHRIT
jgi:hypothetical protein